MTTEPWSDKLTSLYLACNCAEVAHGSDSYPEFRTHHCPLHAAATDMYQVLERLDEAFRNTEKLPRRFNELWGEVRAAIAGAERGLES